MNNNNKAMLHFYFIQTSRTRGQRISMTQRQVKKLLLYLTFTCQVLQVLLVYGGQRVIVSVQWRLTVRVLISQNLTLDGLLSFQNVLLRCYKRGKDLMVHAEKLQILVHIMLNMQQTLVWLIVWSRFYLFKIKIFFISCCEHTGLF